MGQLACKPEVGERAGAALPDVKSMLASAVARHKAGDAAAGDLYRAILWPSRRMATSSTCSA